MLLSQKKLGIIVACKQEIDWKLIKGYLVKITDACFLLQNNTNQICLYISKIGKVNAAIAVSELKKINCSHIINIGSAGKINNVGDNSLDINQVFLINQCFYWDVDVTSFGYQPGEIPAEKRSFCCETDTNQKLQAIIKVNHYSNLATGETFVTQKHVNQILHNFPNDHIKLVDMEGASIAQACDHYQIKFNCIKITSDIVNQTNNYLKWNETVRDIAKHISNILLQILANKKILL